MGNCYCEEALDAHVEANWKANRQDMVNKWVKAGLQKWARGQHDFLSEKEATKETLRKTKEMEKKRKEEASPCSPLLS